MYRKNHLAKRLASCVMSAAVGISVLIMPLGTEKASAEEKLALSFKESAEILQNCDCGYTSTAWIRTAPGKDWTTEVSKYTLLLIGIGPYSTGMGGTDCDFDEIFFKSFEGTLANAKKNGATVGIRFRYDDNGTTNPEPATFEQVLRHIDQIGESGLLEKYSDVISFVETGMVGSWGEQWGGKYTSLENKAVVLDKFLNIVPDPIPVTVRTPNTVRQWLSDYCNIDSTAENMAEKITALAASSGENAKKASRIGLYNDGYMGSDSDLGTFSNRKGETDWLAFAPAYGGEFSGSDEWRMKYTTWQPEYAIAEMYKTNLVRINSNVYKEKSAYKDYDTQAEAQARLAEIAELYNSAGLGSMNHSPSVTVTDAGKYRANWNWFGYDSFTFDKTLDGKLGVGCDNSAFYGKNCFEFIRAHLGYRFVIRSMDMTQNAAPGGDLKLKFTVENTGFSEAPCDKEVELILTNGSIKYTYKTDLNAADWNGAETSSCDVSVALPKSMPGGDWDVFMRISNENDDPAFDNMFCTKLANEGVVYDTSLGANLVGRIAVSGKSDKEKENYPDNRPAGYYPVSEAISVDETSAVNLLDKPYTFTEDGHYGFTFLYKIEGINSEIQLGDWYTGFKIGTSGYSSPYTTYGLNTMNLKPAKDGYYALHIPFYGSVFNCTIPTIANNSELTAFDFNDSRNYWSADTKTILNGNNIKITPIGFVEGGPVGYDVTFHLPQGDKKYSGEYGFNDEKSQTIKNTEAVTVLSLLEDEVEKSYVDETGTWKFVGFTTKKDDPEGLISEDFIAIDSMELYPYYELDANESVGTAFELENNADFQGVRYILDDNTMTAVIGDGSDWKNNSGYSGGKTVIIPSMVISDGKTYTVTEIKNNAFSTELKNVTVPPTVQKIAENAFPDTANVNYIDAVYGDADGNGVFDKNDVLALERWLLNIDSSLANPRAADVVGDNKLNIYDLCVMKRHLV